MRLLVLLLCAGICRAAALPAFPGAEGFGSTTRGGRGGKVVFVVSLSNSGPGTLRAACEAKGARIVVFRVAGLIDLKSDIVVKEPFLTIAGQTAPGDGICLRGGGLKIDTHDVVLRFIRSRLGDVFAERSHNADAIAVIGSSRNVIVDHCSASWGLDETLSPTGAIADVTVQWSIISEGLNDTHHSYGSLVRGVGGISLHHNLWAHNEARNPLFGDNYWEPPFPTIDFRNNVIYNYGGYRPGHGNAGVVGSPRINYVKNYLKPGVDTNPQRSLLNPNPGRPVNATFHMEGNVVAGNPAATEDNWQLFVEKPKGVTRAAEPFAVPAVTTTEPGVAYLAVLANAGATCPVRDEVDRRIVDEVRSGTGSVIDTPMAVGGWPAYRSARPLPDRDHDGMPDDWELALGLNPADSRDAASDRDGDGYTNIEEFINRCCVR